MIPSQLFISGSDIETGGSPEYGYGNEINIPYSIRIDKDRSAYLTKTYETTPSDSNTKIKTFSFWTKRGVFGGTHTIIGHALNATNYWTIQFDTNDKLAIIQNATDLHGGVILNKVSTQVFRDIAAWYHIMIIVDTTNLIPEDRVKAYVNGSRITSWDTNVNPGLNFFAASYLNAPSSTYYSRIGSFPVLNTNFFDGYIAEMHVVDGQALVPYNFGKINDETGQWVAVEYLGTYGNNGFYLNFNNTSSVLTLGDDTSGQDNNWESVNFSLTSGIDYDSFIDTPTNNFPVLNTNTQNNIAVYRKTNLQTSTFTLANAWLKHDVATMLIPSTGKYYWEFQNSGSTSTDHIVIGLMLHNLPVATVAPNYTIGNFVGSYGAYVCRSGNTDLAYIANGVTGTTFGSNAEGDLAAGVLGAIWGFAFDADNNQFQLFKNGVNLGTRSTLTTHSGKLMPALSMYNGNMNLNFGQFPFAYTPPSGFVSLCSKNLPVPSIKRGEIGMDIATYIGNGGNIQIGESRFPIFSYQINKSLRFQGVNNYLTRTPSVEGNKTSWTFSAWVKKVDVNSTYQYLFDANAVPGNSTEESIRFNNNSLSFYSWNGSNVFNKTLTLQFKDTNSFFHLTVAYNTNLATASDRIKIYINGVRQTNFTTSIDPPYLHMDLINSTVLHSIGRSGNNSTYYFNGYLAEINFIDGQELTSADFGEQDINGYWIPTQYLGSYGTNGFYLPFNDTT